MWCLSPSSVTMVTMQENSGKYSSSPDMAYILPAYNPDNTDDVSLKFDPPQHGNLTLYRQVKIINLIEQDCSQPCDIRHPLWNKLTKLISDKVRHILRCYMNSSKLYKLVKRYRYLH